MKKRNIALALGGAVGAAVAVKLLTRAATVNWEDVADLVPHAGNSHFVEVDGARVHYQEFGDATQPPVVLIHGYTASVYVWKTAAPLLAEKGLRVIAIDMLGFGYSDKPVSFDYSIASHARIIVRFMDRMGIGRATVVGSSYGGAVAATVALDYAERVDKLVLVDAVCNDDAKSHPVLRLAAFPGIGEIITPFIADSRMFLRKRMQVTLARANHHMVTNERIDSVRRPLYAADGHHSLLATSRSWSANRIEQDAHLIKHETLLIWGDQDKVIPIKNAYKLKQAIANSRLVVLKDCGHVPQEEKSELFVKLVGEHCNANGRV